MDNSKQSYINTSAGENGSFLPDFCSVRAVLQVVLIGELIAFVIALAPAQPVDGHWTNLGLISLFIQWVGLTSTGLLCISRPLLQRMKNVHATLYSYTLILALTALVSEAAFWLGSSRDIATLMTAGQHSEFLLRNLALSFIVATVALRFLYLQHQSRRHIQAEARARLEALQARIRPHFLFNSMNTIASLTRIRPDAAEQVVEDLADLFRATLNDVSGLTTLREELDLTRRYLNIEALRLGERLRVEWDIDGLPDNALVPLFTVQPLVENAIYHGIERLADGGTIRIHGALADGKISLVITNPVLAHGQTHHDGNHIALDNIRARLAAHYEENGKLSIGVSNGNFIATLSFPYREAGAS